MEILFLGTSTMVPTETRNNSAILLSYKNEKILIDCAEGTQRQLRIAKVSPAKITKLLISHWHGDHVLGIPGLLQTIAKDASNKQIDIYGPKNTKKFISLILNLFIQKDKLNPKIHEITKSEFLNTHDYILKATKLSHTAPCLGYSFIEKDTRKININYLKKFNLKNNPIIKNLQQGKDITYKEKKILASKATYLKKGKKITIILDTSFTKNIEDLAKNSDILISEATYLDDLKDKAQEYKHLTAAQAAQLAKNSKSKKLILTHFSQRYKDINDIKKEATKIFKNTELANDFLKIKL